MLSMFFQNSVKGVLREMGKDVSIYFNELAGSFHQVRPAHALTCTDACDKVCLFCILLALYDTCHVQHTSHGDVIILQCHGDTCSVKI